MLQTLLGRKKYEEAMSDEDPSNETCYFQRKSILQIFFKYKIELSQVYENKKQKTN